MESQFDPIPKKSSPYRGLTYEESPPKTPSPRNLPTASKTPPDDSVIPAIKTCLLLGLLTFWLMFGIGFFAAAAALSTYAMATHRINPGGGFLLISLIGLTFGGVAAALIWTTIFGVLITTG